MRASSGRPQPRGPAQAARRVPTRTKALKCARTARLAPLPATAVRRPACRAPPVSTRARLQPRARAVLPEPSRQSAVNPAAWLAQLAHMVVCLAKQDVSRAPKDLSRMCPDRHPARTARRVDFREQPPVLAVSAALRASTRQCRGPTLAQIVRAASTSQHPARHQAAHHAQLGSFKHPRRQSTARVVQLACIRTRRARLHARHAPLASSLLRLTQHALAALLERSQTPLVPRAAKAAPLALTRLRAQAPARAAPLVHSKKALAERNV